MKFTKKQMLNISTGCLHTEIGDVYKFFNEVVEDGIMTHHLPRSLRAIQPFVHEKLPELPKEGYFPEYEGGSDLVEFELTPGEKVAFWESFKAQDDPLIGKEVIVATI